MKKRLLVVLVPAALAVVGAMMNYAAPVTGATRVSNPGKGATAAPDVNVAATGPVLAFECERSGTDSLSVNAYCDYSSK
jgi:hypothetical protein